MGYNRDNYRRIKEEFSNKHRRAIDAAVARSEELEAKHPDIVPINAVINSVGSKIFDATMSRENVAEKIRNIEKEYNEYLAYREAFLKTCGLPADYLDVHYECDKCKDEGFDDGGKMCTCMKRALSLATYESSGIGNLIKKQSFENFELGYYRDGEERDNMESSLEFIKNFADKFSSETKHNLLFCGPTGLGKTHLSTSVAKLVIDRGYDVVYETAQNVMNDFEKERFSRPNYGNTSGLTDRYFECDLLIIDDLGTELSNQFTVACLYNLINTRINNDKPMIINTNLMQKEIRERYADRITSRLFGEFYVVLFKGKDIRSQKLD